MGTLLLAILFAAPVRAIGTCTCTPSGMTVDAATCTGRSGLVDSAADCPLQCSLGCTGSFTEGAGLTPPEPDFSGSAPFSSSLTPEESAASAGLGGASSIVNQFFAPGTGFNTSVYQPEVVAGKIIQGAIVLIGVIFGILMVYGGYLWMIARGNEEYVKKAIGIIQTAVIGFVIVVAAYAITNYVVERVITAAF